MTPSSPKTCSVALAGLEAQRRRRRDHRDRRVPAARERHEPAEDDPVADLVLRAADDDDGSIGHRLTDSALVGGRIPPDPRSRAPARSADGARRPRARMRRDGGRRRATRTPAGPGTARGRGRIVVDRPRWSTAPNAAAAGVFRRALRREMSRLRDPRRITAIVLLSLTFALLARRPARPWRVGRRRCPGVLGRRPDLAQRRRPVPPNGAVPAVRLRAVDAPALRAVGDPALGRRVVRLARVGTILLLLWTIHWAYRRRPLTTAVIFALLGFPFGANLDTGNINLPADADAVGRPVHRPTSGRAAVGARDLDEMGARDLTGSSSPRARAVGLGWLGVSIALSVITLPLTIIQLQALFGFGARPLRLDYLVYLWAFVPWLYRRPDPFDFLRPATWRRLVEDACSVAQALAGSPRPAATHGPGDDDRARGPPGPPAGARRPAEAGAPRGPIRTTAIHSGPAASGRPPTRSINVPPTAIARTPDEAVATLERPMYRPDEAFGMMSVMSAQSTARKMPAERPNIPAPDRRNGDARRRGADRKPHRRPGRSSPRSRAFDRSGRRCGPDGTTAMSVPRATSDR